MSAVKRVEQSATGLRKVIRSLRELEDLRKRVAEIESMAHEIAASVPIEEWGPGVSVDVLCRAVKDLARRTYDAEAEAQAREPGQQALVDSCNELARTIYAMQGHVVEDGFRFYGSKHPHERACWQLAVVAYEHIEGREVDDALDELREDAEQ